MSEFQYYEFLAVDRALNAGQMAALRELSTRAVITPTSFVNTYHAGELKADPHDLVEQYFDAFLYTSNWGTRRLILRLPVERLDLDTARQYCDTGLVSAWADDDHVIIEMCREHEDSQDDDQPDQDDDLTTAEGWLPSIIPARAGLAAGDLRLLYLAWLVAVDAGEVDDDVVEPPVPPNLLDLDPALIAMIDFLRLDQALLDVAAEASEDLDPSPGTDEELSAWIAGLPAEEKDAMLLRVARGRDADLRADLLRRFGAGSEPPAAQAHRRTVGELLYAAQSPAS
jgi:hypothetical protein